MIPCSVTWCYVQHQKPWSEHDFMFQNMVHVLKHRPCFLTMISCSGTWNHVMEHDFMLKSCFMTWTWFEQDFMFQNMKSCSRTWNHVQIMFDSNRHAQDSACMFTACTSNHKLCNMETPHVKRGQKVFRGQHCHDRSLVILRRCVILQGPIQLWCFRACHCSCQILFPGHAKGLARFW